jgi:hypothetical protein
MARIYFVCSVKASSAIRAHRDNQVTTAEHKPPSGGFVL